MSHPRTLVRQAAVQILRAAKVAKENVEPSMVRAARCDADHMPVCGVYILSESADTGETSPREYARTARLVVEVMERCVDELDDLLDQHAWDVEQALLLDPSLGGAVEDCVLVQTDVTILRQGEVPVGSARLEFEVLYTTPEPQGGNLDDFKLAHTEWKNEADDEIAAIDDIKLPIEEDEA